jgi:hypothetical protein
LILIFLAILSNSELSTPKVDTNSIWRLVSSFGGF